MSATPGGRDGALDGPGEGGLEEGSVTSVEFTADGERLFVGGQDAGYLVDPTSGEELLAFDEADESILDDRLIGDGRLLTGDIAGRVQVWDLEDDTVQATFTHHRQGVGAVAVRGGLVAATTLHVEACPA